MKKIVSTDTYVEFEAFRDWVENRGYLTSDIFEQVFYYLFEGLESVVERIARHKAEISPPVVEGSKEYLQNTCARLLIENRELQSSSMITRKTKRETPLLRPREKQSFLRVISALCNELKIDTTDRGVAVAIEEATQKAGSPVSDDTIRKIIRQINDM